ncbi:MAG: DMT family transporter [Kiritimatiellia bacterium]
MTRQILLLLLGVLACSSAAIFIRNSQVHPIMLSAARLLLAAIALTPVFLRDLKHHRGQGMSRRELTASILPGIILGIHFITWNIGIRMTNVANGSLIVNLVPMAMPVVLYMLIREKLTRREALATGIAIAGTAMLVYADYHLDPQYFLGDLICFGSMIFFCIYLALSRRYRQSRSIWLYVVPLYALAGTFCLLTAIIWGTITRNPEVLPHWYAPREWIWLVCLALIPTITGHSILNHAMKKLRGQVVSIINLTQFAFAGMLAWMIFGEVPHWSLYGTAMILAWSAYLVVTAKNSDA